MLSVDRESMLAASRSDPLHRHKAAEDFEVVADLPQQDQRHDSEHKESPQPKDSQPAVPPVDNESHRDDIVQQRRVGEQPLKEIQSIDKLREDSKKLLKLRQEQDGLKERVQAMGGGGAVDRFQVERRRFDPPRQGKCLLYFSSLSSTLSSSLTFSRLNGRDLILRDRASLVFITL